MRQNLVYNIFEPHTVERCSFCRQPILIEMEKVTYITENGISEVHLDCDELIEQLLYKEK